MPPIPPLPPGLRERQKQERRRAISDAATALFLERGFDTVTMAEVAEAAGVSIKTIFNYFGSKEELFLDRESEAREATLAAITDRPAGTTITDGILALLVEQRVPGGGEGWEVLDDETRREGFRAFLTAWHDSTALRARHLLVQDRLADTLAAALSDELAIPPQDVRIRAMAVMLVAVMHERHRVMAEAVLACAPAAEVQRRVRELSAEAVGRVGAAFPDLDRRRPPGPRGLAGPGTSATGSRGGAGPAG